MPVSLSTFSIESSDEQLRRAAFRQPPGHPRVGVASWDASPGANGEVVVDAMSGRTSVFGFGFAPLQAALLATAQSYRGDSAEMIDCDRGDEEVVGSDFQEDDFQGDADPEALAGRVREIFGEDAAVATDNLLLRPSADTAVDTAIGLARRYQPDKSFRTIALVGSDHGRTGMCRSASGRPSLHHGWGPMMAGFSHVPAGDVDALRAVVDEQTACVLLSPVDLANAAVVCDSDYLTAIREICDEHDILLVMDETQLVLGASGKLLTFSSLADIHADIAIVSAGLFAGLPGGLVMGSARVSPTPITDVGRFPVQAAVAAQTLASMAEHALPLPSQDGTHPLSVAIAKVLGGFEFVRDIHAAGITIGVETDLDSRGIVRAAQRSGLRLARAGSTSVCFQPPLVISEDDQTLLLSRLSQAMESLERESAELAI